MKKKALIFAAVAVPLIVAIVLVVTLVIVPHATNKFRIGVVDDIALGANKEEVREVLGDPYLEEKTRWGYGDKKLCSYLDDAQDISAAMEEALLRGDLERVARLNRQYENLMDEVASKKFSYIEVNFEDDAVVSVLLDKAYALEPGFKKLEEDKLTYTGDGSRVVLPYYIDYTQNPEGEMRQLDCELGEGVAYSGKELSCATKFTDGSYFHAYVKSYEVEDDSYIVWADDYSDHKERKPYGFSAPTSPLGTISADGTWSSNIKFKSITIPANVTSIGEGAFKGCSGLTSIVIPDSVTSIGRGAFEDCNRLISVIWNAENCTEAGSYNYPIFQNCTNLNTVTFGENVKTIPAYAFSSCKGLTSVTIGSGVTSIGRGAFYGCSGLTGELKIPDGVTSIGSWAFDGCSGLESVVWNAENCTEAGSSSSRIFRNCTNLSKAVFGENVKTIPAYAFSSCKGLTSVTIGSGVTSIGRGAFYGCSGLTGELKIPDGVTSIGEDAFYDCSGLTSVTIGNGVTSIGDYAFSHCTGLESVTIGSGVTSIGGCAFYNCSGLKIYYQGTAETWKKISINSDNSNLTYATRYYFTENKPTANEWAEWDYWWHYDEETGEPTPWTK